MSKTALAKAGALGMVHESATNPALSDERDWINSFGDNGWSFNKGNAPLVCFSLTPRSQQYLRQLLEQGPVKVRVDVDTRYYEGQYPYVSGAILGTDGPGAEEVFSLGHIFETGAGDNDTGVAPIIEATATLNRLIKDYCWDVHRLTRWFSEPCRYRIQLGSKSAACYFICRCLCRAPCVGVLPDGRSPLPLERVRQRNGQ
jgi:hypothetical protein